MRIRKNWIPLFLAFSCLLAQAAPLHAVISRTSRRIIRYTAVNRTVPGFDGAALSVNSIEWSWSTGTFTGTGINGYYLYSSSTPDKIALTPATSFYVDAGLGINKPVTRWITVSSGTEEGSDSQHIEKYTYANPPGTFTLSTVTATTAYLEWHYSSATAYAIEGSTDGGATYYRIRDSFVPWQTVNLMSNRNYRLRLGGINGEDVLNPLAYSVVKTTITPPLNMEMYGVAVSSYAINWRWDVSEVGKTGVNSYRIYHSTLVLDGVTPDLTDKGEVLHEIFDLSVSSWTEYFVDSSSGPSANSVHARWIKANGILESTATEVAYKYTYAVAPATCTATYMDPEPYNFFHASETGFSLKWNAGFAYGVVNGIASHFVVDHSTEPDFAVAAASTVVTSVPAPVSGLKSNTKYDMRIGAINGDGEQTPADALNPYAYSAYYKAITNPAPPSDFAASPKTDTMLDFTWSTSTYVHPEYISGYFISTRTYDSALGGYMFVALAFMPGASSTEYALDYLMTNSSHTLYVSAVESDPDCGLGPNFWCYEAGVSDHLGALGATFATPPNDVAIDTVGARSLKMWWEQPQVPATKYRVQRSSNTGELGPWTLIADVTTYYFEDTGLTPSTTYSYRIGAINQLGVLTSGLGAATGGHRRDYSFVSSTITKHVAPVLYGVATGTSSINWSWTDTVPGVTAYNLYASSGQVLQLGLSGSATFYSEINISSANARMFRRVRSVAPDGEGDYTDAAVSTLANPPAAAAPVAAGLHAVNLGWTANGSARYGIYRSADGSSWTELRGWSGAVSSGPYADTGLHYATTYYYALRGYNDDGILSVSSAVSSAVMTPALPASYTAVYSTASAALSVTAPLSGSGQITVTLPAGSPDGYFTLSTGAYLNPSEVTKAGLDAAIAKLSGEALLTNSITELHFYDVYGVPVVSALPSPARVTITYADANDDGIVDGSSPQMQVPTLKIFSLDDSALVWNQIRESTLNRPGLAVYADIPHFSIYALGSVTSAAGPINEVFAYPNPYRPGSSGLFGQPSLGDGIVFESLPAGAKIRIFSIYGAEVASLTDTDGDGRALWDTRTKDGSKAASGVYLFLVNSPLGKKTGKVAIIR